MKENQIGALWYSRTENHKAPFAKGSITVGSEKIPIVIWKNRWKEPGEATPDYYIERDIPRQVAQRGLPKQGQVGAGTAQGDGFDGDIPF